MLNVHNITIAEPFYFSPLFLMTHKKSGGDYQSTKGKIILKRDPLIQDYKKKIKSFSNINFFINFSNYPFTFFEKNVYYLFRNIPELKKEKEFITNKIDSFAGSIRFTILLAIFMGFKKIYLIGFDYLFSPSQSGHWFEKGKGVPTDPSFNLNEYQKSFLDITKDFCEIISVTVEGGCKNLESIEYSKLTNSKLNYKENYEIIERKNLKLLSSSTWHSYRVY